MHRRNLFKSITASTLIKFYFFKVQLKRWIQSFDIISTAERLVASLLLALKVSRPGLWGALVWLYVLPHPWPLFDFDSPAKIVGLVYVTFPLNFF